MGMSSSEVVRRAIEFDYPDRLPMLFEELGLSDIHTVRWNQTSSGDETKRQTIDDFGCVWSRSEQKNMGLVTGHPLENWDAIDHYTWPDADDPAFYKGMEDRFAGSDGKYVRTNLHMLLFERMSAIRGFENTLADLKINREGSEYIADHIVEFDLGIIRQVSSRFPGRILGMIFSDDWGTQQGLIINPDLWRDFFKPRYARIFEAIHGAGWHIWFHSCGKINQIMDEFIDLGVDVVNLQQPRLLGIEEIGEKYRGRICFDALCDIQQTLPLNDHNAIIEEAALLLREWATPAGGFILDTSGEDEALGMSEGTKKVMIEAFQKADHWRKA